MQADHEDHVQSDQDPSTRGGEEENQLAIFSTIWWYAEPLIGLAPTG